MKKNQDYLETNKLRLERLFLPMDWKRYLFQIELSMVALLEFR